MDVLDRLVGTIDSLPTDQTHWFGNPQYPVQCRGWQREQKAIVDASAFLGRVDRKDGGHAHSGIPLKD
jgi:hypothetical protein